MNILEEFVRLMMKNWYISLGIVSVILFIGLFFYTKRFVRPSKEVLYFSEAERVLDYMNVIELTPKQVKCEGNISFHRRTLAYLAIKMGRPVTTFLGKRGIGYTFKPEDTPEGKALKLGSIFDGIVNVLGDDIVEKMLPEHIKKLKDSIIFVTVELERTPDVDKLPVITERDVFSEANLNMASLIGERIANALHREDWIRNIGLIAVGVALLAVSQMMGIV